MDKKELLEYIDSIIGELDDSLSFDVSQYKGKITIHIRDKCDDYECEPVKSDCSICTINPENLTEDLQKAGRSYTPPQKR